MVKDGQVERLVTRVVGREVSTCVIEEGVEQRWSKPTSWVWIQEQRAVRSQEDSKRSENRRSVPLVCTKQVYKQVN